MSAIFISYNRKDQQAVQALAADIEALGHSVWLDQKISGGQQWWDGILQRIRESDVFVLGLGGGTLDSTACQRELAYARSLSRPVLPVLLSDNVSTNLLPPALSAIQILDYRDKGRDAVIHLSRAIASLPPAPALPEPLPEAPAAPLSYLGGLAERVDTLTGTNAAEQTALLFELKGALRDPGTAADARKLLEKMRTNRELLASVATEIEEILNRPTPRPWTFGKRAIAAAAIIVLAVAAVFAYRELVRPPPDNPVDPASTAAATEASPAQPSAAQPAGARPGGATVTGRILYAQKPITEVSNAPAVITLMNIETRTNIEADVRYDHTTSEFQISSVPVGQFMPFVRIESGYPFDRESGGDFISSLSGLNDPIAVAPNADRIQQDLKVVHVIRLKNPVDNQEVRTLAGDPYEVFSVGIYAPTAKRFVWDPVPGAASYRLNFSLMDDDRRVDFKQQSVTDTEYAPNLLVATGNQYYSFSMTAHDQQNNQIGAYMHYYINGSGTSMNFRTVDGAP